VLSPVIVPLHTNRVVRALNSELLTRYVSWAVRRLGLRRPVLWSFVPQAEVLLDRFEFSQILYYTDDDYPAKAGIDAESFLAAERRFAPRADVILASAPELVTRMRALNDNVFAQALEPGAIDAELAALPGPRIVFIGAILAAKIDLELVIALARLRPQWSFAFVGPIGPGDPRTNVDSLRDVPNIQLLGHRPYEQLPDVLRGADATIVPYLLDGEMRSVFPMKTYEYLAAGRPVVSTPLETLEDVPEVIKAATAEEFAARLQEAIEGDTEALRTERSRGAQSHSWESRLDQIAVALRASHG
jgi:glycosyltransferase involved in cell wall biosynthesis